MEEHTNYYNTRDNFVYPPITAPTTSTGRGTEEIYGFITQSSEHHPSIIHTPRSSTDSGLLSTANMHMNPATQPKNNISEIMNPVYASTVMPSRTPPESPMSFPHIETQPPLNSSVRGFWPVSNPVAQSASLLTHPPHMPPGANGPETRAMIQPHAAAHVPHTTAHTSHTIIQPPHTMAQPSHTATQPPQTMAQPPHTAAFWTPNSSMQASAIAPHRSSSVQSATQHPGQDSLIVHSPLNNVRLTASSVLDIKNYCTPEEYVIVDTDENVQAQLSVKKHELSEWYRATNEWYRTKKNGEGLTENMQQELLKELSRKMYSLKEFLKLDALVAAVPELPVFVDPYKLDLQQVFNILNYLNRAEYDFYTRTKDLATSLTQEVQQIQKKYKHHAKQDTCTRSKRFFCRILADRIKAAKERLFVAFIGQASISVPEEPHYDTQELEKKPQSPDTSTNSPNTQSNSSAPQNAVSSPVKVSTPSQKSLSTPSQGAKRAGSHSAIHSRVSRNASNVSPSSAFLEPNSYPAIDFYLPPFTSEKRLHRKRVFDVKNYCTREERALMKTNKSLCKMLNSEIKKLRDWYKVHPKKKKGKRYAQKILRHLSHKVYSMKDRIFGAVLGGIKEISVNRNASTFDPHLNGYELVDASHSQDVNVPPVTTGTDPVIANSSDSPQASPTSGISVVNEQATRAATAIRTTPALNNLVSPPESTKMLESSHQNETSPGAVESSPIKSVSINGASSDSQALPASSVTEPSTGIANNEVQAQPAVKVPACILRPLFPLRPGDKSPSAYNAADSVGIKDIKVPDCLLRRSHPLNTGREAQVSEVVNSSEAEATDPTDPADITEPTDPAELSGPIKRSKQAKLPKLPKLLDSETAAKSVVPTAPAKPELPTNPEPPANSTTSVSSTDRKSPVSSVKSANPDSSVGPTTPGSLANPVKPDTVPLPPSSSVSDFYNIPTGENVKLASILKIFDSFSPKQKETLRSEKSLSGLLCLALESLLRRYGVLTRKVTDMEKKQEILNELREKLYGLEKTTVSVYDSVKRKVGHPNKEAKYATLLEIGVSSLSALPVRTSLNPYMDIEEDIKYPETAKTLEKIESSLIPPVVMPLGDTGKHLRRDKMSIEHEEEEEGENLDDKDYKENLPRSNNSGRESNKRTRSSPMRNSVGISGKRRKT